MARRHKDFGVDADLLVVELMVVEEEQQTHGCLLSFAFGGGCCRCKKTLAKEQIQRCKDTENGKDVAIKIIKSKKPFLIQAKTEIELLTHLNEKDIEDQHNIGKFLNICGHYLLFFVRIQ